MNKIFYPKIAESLRNGYSLGFLLEDLTSGVIVGIVALPLAIAFGMASGATPLQGLITAIIGGFLISLLSGSRFQIGGPTGAFIVLVLSTIQKFGYDGLIIATIMAGIILVIMGIAKLGKLIEFIPYPVTIGFTSGIALIIAIGQLSNTLGIRLPENVDGFLNELIFYAKSINSVNYYSLAFTLLTIIIVKITSKYQIKIPGSLISIILFSFIVKIFDVPVETIGDRFGKLNFSFPRFSIPTFNPEIVTMLFPSAFAIAILGGIESLLSAVVADGMTGDKHRSNTELIAQGIANIITPLWGGLPATGAIARTATNIKNGARSPLSGIFHALALLLIVVFAGDWASLIPLPVLAGILIVVAYNMGEWHLFFKIIKSTKSDTLVLISTFLLTVFVDLSFAIQFGVVMAALLFMKRMSDVVQVDFIKDDDLVDNYKREVLHEGIEVFEINGPFFFGATNRYQVEMNALKKNCKVLIFRMRYVPAMDVTGLKAFEDTLSLTKNNGITVMISGIQKQPRNLLMKSNVWSDISSNTFETFSECYNKALLIVDK